MKTDKKVLKNAIMYIKDYTHAYNERSASATARKLLECVNVVIEHYNETESQEVDLGNEDLMRDMFIGLAFGDYSRWIMNINKAMQVPMEYYVKRISEHYLDVEDIHLRFYKAYKDYVLRETFKEMLEDAQKDTKELREIAGIYSKEHLEVIIALSEENIDYLKQKIQELS